MTSTHILLALALAAAAVLVACGRNRGEGLIDCYDLNTDRPVPLVCRPDYMGRGADGRIVAGGDGTRKRYALPTDSGWEPVAEPLAVSAQMRFNCNASPEAVACGGPGGRAAFTPRIQRPKNGQCPVCGTMAQPYHLRRSAEGQEAMYLHHLGQHNQRFTICAHCNTVFRQWAEGKEPKR